MVRDACMLEWQTISYQRIQTGTRTTFVTRKDRLDEGIWTRNIDELVCSTEARDRIDNPLFEV